MVDLLVAFDRKAISMTRLISEVMILLDDHSELISGFRPFLPSTWSITGPTDV